MWKEYFSEAVSLLAEAVLGKPTPAGACWYEYKTEGDYCNSCGLEKRIYRRYRRLCCSGGCYAWILDAQWCDYC